MRSLAAGVLLAVFAVLVPTLNLGTWAERVIFDEDTFVGTVDGILDEPAVQQALAERIADRIVEEIDVPSATTRVLTEVRAELGAGESPGSVALLAGPLERGARELLVRASLAVLEQRLLDDQFETALRAVHRTTRAIIRENQLLTASGGEVVIDLRPYFEGALAEVGGEDAEGFLADLELSDDVGRIVVIEDSDLGFVWWLAGVFDDLLDVLAIITLAVALLAIALSRDRSRMVIWLGAAMIASTLLLLTFNPVVRHFATAWVEADADRAATRAIYDEILQTLRLQSLVILAGGGLLALAGAAVRGRWLVRTRGVAQPAFTDRMRRHVRVLRVGGLAVAAAALLVWPEPSRRVIIEVGLLLGTYLALIQLFVSDAGWASSSRTWFAELMQVDHTLNSGELEQISVTVWIAERTAWFRWGAAAVIAMLIALLPSHGTDAIVTLTVLALLYFGAIELIVGAADGATGAEARDRLPGD